VFSVFGIKIEFGDFGAEHQDGKSDDSGDVGQNGLYDVFLYPMWKSR
jgi:hypothetical protein